MRETRMQQSCHMLVIGNLSTISLKAKEKKLLEQTKCICLISNSVF